MAREFYRIVRDEQSTLDDFRSARELGKPPVPKYLREWAASISIHDDLEYSMAHARANRLRLGRYIAKLVVPEDGSVEISQTTRLRHHVSLLANPQVLLSFVEGDTLVVRESER